MNAADPSRAPTRLERYAPYVLGAVLALPLLFVRYPPMTDLPLHECIVAILRHRSDRAWFPPGLYEMNLGEPNQLFHLAAWGLSFVFPTATACKLVVAAILFAIPVAAAKLARHVGASPLGALLVAPIALGWLFAWGLVANLAGLAALMISLVWLDRLGQAPTWKNAVFAVLGAVLLYFAHEAMMIVYGGSAVLFAIAHARRFRDALVGLVPFAAAVAIALAQAEYQKRFMTPGVARLPTVWLPFWRKLADTSELIVRADLPVELTFTALIALTMALFIWLRHRERQGAPRVSFRPFSWSASVRPFVHRYRFELFVLANVAAYLTFPITLHGATLVYQRFFAPAFVVFAVVCAPRELVRIEIRGARLAAPALALAIPLGTLFMKFPSFLDADYAYRELDKLLALVPQGVAVAQLDLGPRDPTRDFSLGSAAARVLAERGGRLLYGFTDSPISAAVVPQRYQWQEPILRCAMSKEGAFRFVPAHDFRWFSFLLLRSTSPDLQRMAARALAPYAEAVDSAYEWALYRSRLPPEPLLSPDPPPPPEGAPTLRSLMLRAIEADALEHGAAELIPAEGGESAPGPR